MSDEKKIVIDEELCIGCGACAETAPENFELGDDGIAKVKKQYSEVGEEEKKHVQDAVDGCPANAITLE